MTLISNVTVNTSIIMMKIYHYLASFLEGNVESETSYSEMIDKINDLSPLIPEDVMAEINSFVDELSDLVYGDALDCCYSPECGHIEETANGQAIWICETPQQTELLCKRYTSVVAQYIESLEILAEHVLLDSNE